MREIHRTDSDDGVFDRLADGELTCVEYRELLRSLEQRPDGWRRCALAFLEAQAWSHDLLGAQQGVEATVGWRAHETPNLPHSSAKNGDVTGNVRERPPFRRRSVLLAIAAGFLVAFGLGVVVRWPIPWLLDTWQRPSVVKTEHVEYPSPRVANSRDGRPQVVAAAPVAPEGRGNVRLVVHTGAGGEGEPFDLPVVDLSPKNAWLLSSQNPTVSAEVQRLFQRVGGQLRWERHVVSLRTLDGRQILVPLEQMEVTPVRGQRYQ